MESGAEIVLSDRPVEAGHQRGGEVIAAADLVGAQGAGLLVKGGGPFGKALAERPAEGIAAGEFNPVGILLAPGQDFAADGGRAAGEQHRLRLP